MPFHTDLVCVRDEDDNLLFSITHADHMGLHMTIHVWFTPETAKWEAHHLTQNTKGFFPGQHYQTRAWQW